MPEESLKAVLIVDDKASSRELVRTVLEHSGYAVAEAADGVEALDELRKSLPDVVLLDLHMPRMDGFAVLAEMRRDPQLTNVPVIAVTASAMQGDREKAIAAGFTSYLTKPLTLAVLRRELQKVLEV